MQEQAWTLDGLGNWSEFDGVKNGDPTSQTRTHNKANEIIDITTDGSTNLTYDDNGNLTCDGYLTYSYDIENRLTRVQTVSERPDTIAEISYDALGRRVRKVVTNADDYNGDYRYVWNQDWQLMQVYTYASSTYTLKQNLVHAGSPSPWYPQLGVGGGHAYVDDHVMIERNGSGKTRYFYHADAQYNTQMVTNVDHVSAASYVMTPYGKVETVTQPGSGNLGLAATNSAFIHQGLAYDAELGSYYNRNRQYLPGLGRFAQRDPTEYKDGFDLYVVDQSRPTDRVDPTGNGPEIPLQTVLLFDFCNFLRNACASRCEAAEQACNFVCNNTPFLNLETRQRCRGACGTFGTACQNACNDLGVLCIQIPIALDPRSPGRRR